MKPVWQRAFTLVELLMVMLIIAITTAITVPYFVRSLRGNRLRTAARTVVMAGRYARSMALLKQEELLLIFDLDNATLQVETRFSRPTVPEPEPARTGPEAGIDDAGPTPPQDSGEQVRIRRVLEDVHLDYVELDDGRKQRVTEGRVAVVYRTNGRCTPYTVRIVDADGRAVVTRVDALSTATTEGD